jgi:tetratricopeptide (TPR) repeat protein
MTPPRLILVFLVTLTASATISDDWTNLCAKGQQAVLDKDYARAESIYGQALHTAEMFGKNDVRVASTERSLGVSLRGEKKLSAAEEAVQRAVSIYSVSPGTDSLEFAEAQFDLAGILMDEGKYPAALQSLNLLLAIFDKDLDPKDDKNALALCMEGDTYRMLKRYGSAETPLKRCAEIQSDNGEIDTPGFGEVANSLALVYQYLGKTTAADRYFTLAEKVREKSLGLLSPELAETLEAHAALLRQLGRAAEAKPKERMAAAIRSHAGKR